MEGWRKTNHTNTTEKEAGIAILILDSRVQSRKISEIKRLVLKKKKKEVSSPSGCNNP